MANEAIADIVAEMRGYVASFQGVYGMRLPMSFGTFGQYIDRIEAAARRAYNEIDSAVCGIDDASHSDIDDVRKAMEETIGDYYE